MFGIGFSELVIIAVAALVLVGPKRLPELARQFGRFFVQIRRVSNEVRNTFEGVIRDAEEEMRREERAALQKLLSVKQEVMSGLDDRTIAQAKPVGPVQGGNGANDHAWDSPAETGAVAPNPDSGPKDGQG